MYNGSKINDLLKEHNLKQADLLAHLGLRENGSITRFLGSDIKASRLEQIADFFGVSIDVFFVREVDFESVAPAAAAKTRNYLYGSATSRAREAETRVKSLERELKTKDELLAERNRTIALMQQMIEMLQNPGTEN